MQSTRKDLVRFLNKPISKLFNSFSFYVSLHNSRRRKQYVTYTLLVVKVAWPVSTVGWTTRVQNTSIATW